MALALPFNHLRESFASRPLFADKVWRLSPEAWPLSQQQVLELGEIGQACLEFYRAMDVLYRRSAENRPLLRNRELRAPWVAHYLDRGKPSRLVAHGRLKHLRSRVPCVIRPDLLVTEDGFALTELDSVPGGFGLTAFLNNLYSEQEGLIGESGQVMAKAFFESLRAEVPDVADPLMFILVSDEAATYRPEFEYLAEMLRQQGRRIYVGNPEELMLEGGRLFISIEGKRLQIDLIYRFWELFDLDSISTTASILETVEAGEVVVTPPMKAYHEEKLNLALFHHYALEPFWRETLSKRAYRKLNQIIPPSWIMDPVDLPPNAVLDAPPVQGKPILRWEALAEASQKERNWIIKASGFHESAWGGRSVTFGSDVSREAWEGALAKAIAMAGTTLHILQEYKKPLRQCHPVYAQAECVKPMEGRLRLCPYYLLQGESVSLSGILATFCPADKKIIHGMKDAVLLPCYSNNH